MPKDTTFRTIDETPQPPPQYALGESCTECRRPLSRYNCYTVCGPCRHNLSVVIPPDDVRFAEDVEAAGFAWERFPKRQVVRRGPLMPDEEDRSGVGGVPSHRSRRQVA